MLHKVIENDIKRFLEEDDLHRHFGVAKSLPMDLVHCSLKIKSPMTLAGVAWFGATFNYLGAKLPNDFLYEFEGKEFIEPYQIDFELPFAIALTGERVALNLLARASAVATHTKRFVDLTKNAKTKILDTRKTTPGLRSLEKYAVTVGGGLNHRFGPSEMWMVKDNHKTFFGGVEKAVNFFKSQSSAYAPIEVEVHDLAELSEALELGVHHIMLDNFSPEMVKQAIKTKKVNTTFEVSGGINLQTLKDYLIDGVDFISIGSLTYGAPAVDLSLKHGAKA
tara:strand:- start:3310 stop:4146 length:837 start_codon:yes stop_codon:yes gene_type:complete